eukprot:m.1637183 g.1637183  ORF g.1637183 m.1637183 type:complete len:57 (-) comp25552_c0_seq1:276-446(-)
MIFRPVALMENQNAKQQRCKILALPNVLADVLRTADELSSADDVIVFTWALVRASS